MSKPLETIGPYSLEKLLGSGGMGQVYQAYDQRLHRRVAIKQFQNGERTDTVSRKRFLHEARSAASLSHPSIVQIHDILEDESGDWIVMERVDGPTVAELVAQGPLPVARAVTIARQVAEGLAEAHDQGILHRDLKSENVMLAKGERAKILDFGLAKRLWPGDQTASLSAEGRVLGTCRAMSPEQARCLELDARSDLFSLGVLLYEMLTGQSPFHADNHTDTLTRVCHFRPPPISDLRSDVPPELVELVARLLEKERARRPQSAQEVVGVLAVLDATLSPSGSTSGAVSLPPSSGSTEPVSLAPGWLTESVYLGLPGQGGSRRWLPWAVAGIVLLVAVVGLWGWQRVTEPAIPVRPSVAVLSFKNVSGDPELDWLGTAIAEVLASVLGAGEDLRTVPGETVSRALQELDLPVGVLLSTDSLERLRPLTGADKVIVGSYLAEPGGDEVRIFLQVQDVQTGEAVNFSRPEVLTSQVVDAIQDLARTLRIELGAGFLTRQELNESRASLPRTDTARRLYSEGLTALRNYDFPEARVLLRQAVEEESDFPLSHAELAKALSALGFDRQAREAAEQAAELAGSLSQRERQFVRARNYEMSFEWQAAVEAYTSLWEDYSDETRYGLGLAQALAENGEVNAAFKVIEAIRRMPSPVSDDPQIDVVEIEILRDLAQYERMLEIINRVEQRGRELQARNLTASVLLQKVFGLLRTGDLEGAMAAAQEAYQLFEGEGNALGKALALNRIGNVHYESGSCTEARPLFEEFRRRMEAMGNFSGTASALNNVASCATMQGDLATTEVLLRDAVAHADEVGNVLQNWLSRINLAELQLRYGDLEDAREELWRDMDETKQESFPYAENFALMVAGDLRLAAGDLTGARDFYEQALELNLEVGDARYLSFSYHVLGALERRAGNLGESREHLEGALKLRRELQDAHFGAQSQVELGITLLELGRPREARRLAQQAGSAFRTQRSPERELEAVALEISALLALGEDENLPALLARGEELLAGCESVLSRLWSQTQMARARQHLGQTQRARTALRDVLETAADHGLVPLELEARLALAELEEAEGRALDAQELRQEVSERAESLGLGLLARQASDLLAKRADPEVPPPRRPELRDAA